MASGNIFIDALALRGWLDVGGDRNITYYFDETVTARPWGGFEMLMWQIALQQWANVANITTQQVFSPAGADLQEMWVTNAFMQNLHGTAFHGWHNLPSTSPPVTGEYNTAYGGTYWTTDALAPGGVGFRTFVHELGHALGLLHPHSGITFLPGHPVFPGVTGPSDLGTLNYNQDIYSLMSYNYSARINSSSLTFGHPVTPMAFDIAAIQFLYGPNTTHRTGSDVYVLPGINAVGTSWQCIWDAGGTDTIRYDGNLSATFDLRSATLANGDPDAGGFVSQVADVFGGFTIANGVVIENAIGGKGNDTLIGNSADNSLDGGAGDDTVIFSGPRAAYTVTDLGGSVRVAGPEGTDTLTSIEHLQFSAGTITPVNDSALFDTAFYLSHNPDVFHANANALAHYNAHGWREGRDPDEFFSTNFYLGANPDVRAIGVNPLDHYHRNGWREGRDPGPNFDTGLYLSHNPDVAAAGMDPLEHYLQYGRAEGRPIHAAVGNIVGGFDAQYYLLHNPDVAAARVDPLAHYNIHGWHEGRNPNAIFDTAGYLSHYADVAAAGMNPLQHYQQYGWHEGRDPSAAFDTLGYLAAHTDVAAANINPLDHYLQYGIHEGRQIVSDGIWH